MENGEKEGEGEGNDLKEAAGRGYAGDGADVDDGADLVRRSSEVLKRRRGLFMPHHTLCAANCFFSRFPLYDSTVIPY